MSERRILSVLLACVAAATPVRAQELAQLKRHEAELAARLTQLQANAAAVTEMHFWRQPRTVIASGALRVAYPQGIDPAEVAQLPVLLQAMQLRYGRAIDSLLTDTLYVGLEVGGASGASVGTMAIWRLGPLRGERSAADGWLGSVVAAALQDWSFRLLDPDLRSWLGAIDARATTVTLRDPLVRDLVSSPSSRAHRCLRGVVDECRLLLELDEGATPLLAAYDPIDLPSLFARMELGARIQGRANCTGKRDPAACAELVRQGRVLPPHPVSARGRQSLFAHALRFGGEDAWLRLHRSQGLKVSRQLATAAGRPVDSLLASWQRDLVTGRRTTTAGVVPSLTLALAWGLIGLLLFTWRYRWRRV